ncbi:MAG: ribonuclease HI [Acidobacteriota bacterium]
MFRSNGSDGNADVLLFTDGACSGNPGPGGWACLLRHVATGKELEASGAEPMTTNNKMELQAVIEGLRRLKRKTRVHVLSDSSYVLQGITQWIHNWKRNGWRRRSQNGYKPVKNVEYWQALDQLVGRHDVSFEHIRGHSGHPENERCDRLAVDAYQQLKNSRN